MSPGKQASESDAAPPMAAGARLEKMRRRVRLSRLVLFTAIAAGPVALGVAVMSGPTTVAAAPSDKPTAVRSAAAAADPAGYAQVFVDAWLRSSAGDANSAQARLAQSLAPDVDLPDPVARVTVRGSTSTCSPLPWGPFRQGHGGLAIFRNSSADMEISPVQCRLAPLCGPHRPPVLNLCKLLTPRGSVEPDPTFPLPRKSPIAPPAPSTSV
ncbi:hypothetical protein [Streptomyces mirabilis]|uniref:hypothetical protein n=1 Tax=Streptomyces mirabilis TaxID=68239 RepID=UPI0036CB5960